MYTQCPDCNVAFRVTADVLKQAAGKVRCGGCGSAFNALDFLSEDRPTPRPRRDAEAELPELKPDPSGNDGELPVSISAEQSAALLKTLDELAGSDIRIEDTGVEWRVLDDDEVGEAADDAIAVDVEIEDQPQIDEILDESPTPVDQFLTDTPPVVDAPEIFEESAAEPAHTPVDELRFDDNTPLPDDFDFDDESRAAPAAVQEPDPDPVIEEAPQVDLELSEPDEWTDILDEFEDIAEELSEPAAADEDPYFVGKDAQDDDVSHDDAPAPLDDDDLDALLAEHSREESDIECLLEEGVVDEIDQELAEFGELDDEPEDATEAEEAARLDLTDNGDDDSPAYDEDVVLALDEDDAPDLYEDEDVALASDEDDAPDLYEDEDEDEDEDIVLALDEDEAPDLDGGEDEPPAGDGDGEEAPLEHYVPPMTEEEQTINLQIDQDLLAIAVEDDDGFASTIVIPEDAAAESLIETPKLSDEAPAPASGASGESGGGNEFEFPLADTGEGFETIIMEGEFVRSELDQQKLAADAAAAASLAGAAAAEREAEENARKSKVNYRLVAGIVVLALLLVGQYLHQSRESLATIPAFNSVAGPMYRAIGQPLSPAWNVTAWRFEATRGSTDDAGNNLTIYSRIGNNSENPLPYPLIAISLTDRFEETIGSRVLDPADYLANNLDPRNLVEPGANFNAAISIQAPTDEATGFKLNVCYRESGGDLRCAIDDFK